MKVEIHTVQKIAMEILTALNISKKDAQIITNAYIEADLCGVSTHGFNIFPEHIRKFMNGTYPIQSNINTEKETVSFSVLNANGCIRTNSGKYCNEFGC